MQICPHCANGIDELTRTCDHCGHIVLENSIDEALHDLDLKLAASKGLTQMPMPGAPAGATSEPSPTDASPQSSNPIEALPPSDGDASSGWADHVVTWQPADIEAWCQHADPIVIAPPPHVEATAAQGDPIVAPPPDSGPVSDWADPIATSQPAEGNAWRQGWDPFAAAAPSDGEPTAVNTDPLVASHSAGKASSRDADPIAAWELPDTEASFQHADPIVFSQPSDSDAWTRAANPIVPSPPSAADPSLQDVRATPSGSRWKTWPVAVTAVTAFAVGGAAIMVGRPARPAPTRTVRATARPNPAPQARVAHAPTTAARVLPHASAAADSSRSTKWARARQPVWASDGSRIVSFELEAENDVRVWMKHVRPVLAVRCLGRQMELFVITDSAMSIEPTPDRHTVHVGFDGGVEREERWLDSAAKRELFAPDSMTLAGRIAGAQTMRFGFTPYSASPVVVNFDVRGFTNVLEPVARTCGWPSKAKAASARTGG